jgi:hypothetical protein
MTAGRRGRGPLPARKMVAAEHNILEKQRCSHMETSGSADLFGCTVAVHHATGGHCRGRGRDRKRRRPCRAKVRAFQWSRSSGHRTRRIEGRNMSLIQRISTLRTLSFAAGVMLGLVSAVCAEPGTGQLPAHRPGSRLTLDHGPTVARTGQQPTAAEIIGVPPSAALPQARRSCTARIAKCSSSTTRSCARCIPRSAPRRDAPE